MKASDLRGKYVFWDVDGVLAEFRFCGKVHPNSGISGVLTQELVDAGAFEERKPIKSIQRLMKSCGAAGHYVLGRWMYEGEIRRKEPWLTKYYPEIKEYLWVDRHRRKVDVLALFLAEREINQCDAVFIDDTHEELWEVELCSEVTCYHISSLLDWEEE